MFFILLNYLLQFLNFTMAAKKGTQILIRTNKPIYFCFIREKGPKFDQEIVQEKYDKRDIIQESLYDMLCFAILCYGMVWSVLYAIGFLCYDMCMLCNSMGYVEKG